MRVKLKSGESGIVTGVFWASDTIVVRLDKNKNEKSVQISEIDKKVSKYKG